MSSPQPFSLSPLRLLALPLAGLLLASCAAYRSTGGTTERDKTKKGAAGGAAAGAVGAILLGETEAEEILAGAAIGAGVGGGVGAYMDHQEERFARIPGTTVERVGEETLLVHFDSDVLFDVDSAVVDPSSRTTLERLASVLLDFPKTAVVIQGHTDSTGSETHNLELSRRRADAVYATLVSRGVDSARMTSVGHGEAYPVASNDTEAGRQHNRRVDILLKAKAR